MTPLRAFEFTCGSLHHARSLMLLGCVATVVALPAVAQPAATAAPAAAAPARVTLAQFRDLRWLEGTWRGRTPDGQYFYERYERVNDSTIRIVHFPDSTLATPGETETITLRGGTVQHGSANAIRFDANGIAFARPSRATPDFSFAPSANGWTATIHRSNGPAIVYDMRRWSPPASLGNSRRQASSDREAVRRAVLDYVEGFYEGDTAKLVRAMWPEVRKYGYSRDQASGQYRGSAMPYPAGFMNYANSIRMGRNRTPANAPKDVTIFEVQDQTASAKLTAWWGTDYLLLAKENDRWMITHVLWQSPPPR